MIKMANIYNRNAIPLIGMPASNMAATLDSFKGLLAPTELAKLKKLQDLLAGRAVNFKQMLNLLNADDIMDKFKNPAVDLDGINLEDLEAGLNQMC